VEGRGSVGLTSEDGVDPTGDVELRVSPVVGLLDQAEIVTNLVDRRDEQAHPAPVVGPLVPPGAAAPGRRASKRCDAPGAEGASAKPAAGAEKPGAPA
jgi:hypothetical protein